jgi:glycosyltransferase involved in cell wall biosynthesis
MIGQKNMINKVPKVSIGLPVYNGERFLREALDSILSQTFEDFELIISDNASTDKTEEICREYTAKDMRIRYYRNEKNLGAAKNYNRVFELSNGKYFKWAAHDDICAPTYLERCIEVLDENPSVVLCYPKTIIIDEYGNHIEKYFDNLHLNYPKPHERFKHFHICYRSPRRCNPLLGLIRASVLKKTPLIQNYIASDMILLGELALLGEFYEISEYLFFRRDHRQTSVKANPTYYERTLWFDPQKKGKILLPSWRWFCEYIISICRVQLSLHDRIMCLFEMVKWVRWYRRMLRNDFKTAIVQFLNRYELGRKLLETRRHILRNKEIIK